LDRSRHACSATIRCGSDLIFKGGTGHRTRDATEAAQQVIDSAVQLFGGTGVVSGSTVESLYRDIRALRIYEGTSEIQKLVIAGAVLAGDGENNEQT